MRVQLSFLVLALTISGTVLGQTYTINTFAGGGPPEGIPAVSVGLGHVLGVAADAAGNVYFTSVDYHVILRRDRTGMLARVAGTFGFWGIGGDNGPATDAQLNWPCDITVDSAGNLYIADTGNHRIRKISNGVITTVAGNGTRGYSGDNSLAVDAQLYGPSGVALDSAGNLYIADSGNNRIRKISNGIITTVAGNGAEGFGGDNGPATGAQLKWPWDVAVDSTGNLYIADGYNHRIRRVSNGVIMTVAGNGSPGYSGDNGPALNAQLHYPACLALDAAGNLYIADSDNHRIRKISNGIITTVAGNGNEGYSGDNGSATSAQLNGPTGVAVDSTGDLYVADCYNYLIRRISSGFITTVAGNGTEGYSGDNGSATSAQLNGPTGVVVDSTGDLYIADSGNHRIRKVSNEVITTVAGNGTEGYSGDIGPATNAELRSPNGIAVDGAGNLYIADSGDNRIRMVSNGVISTVAGNGAHGYSGDDGLAVNAQLAFPVSVAVDSAGNLYISDGSNNRLRKVSNGVITTVAGNGAQGYSGDNGPATSAQLYAPNGIAVDGAGNLYFADSGNHCIRKVSNGIITTVAGNGTAGYSGDNGPATSAQLFNPFGVAVDSAGNLYIADGTNYRIRRVSNGVITTLAGNGTSGFSGDNGPATSARLGLAYGVALDAAGRVYLTDAYSYRVRILTPGAASPCSYAISTTDLGVVAAGGTLTVSVQTASNCSWSLTGLPAWLTVSGNSQGTGPATVTLVASNNPGETRTGVFTVGGVSVPVRQPDAAACGGSPSCIVRSLPHLAFGGEWTTGLSAINSGTAASSYSVSFYDNGGASVALPFTGGLGNLSTVSNTVAAQGLQYYEADNPSAPVQAGWGLVTTEASVTVQAIFRRHTAGGDFYEAAVPASEGYSTFIVPFEATTFAPAGVPMFTGLAINNLNPSASANVMCTARDQAGQIIANAISIPALKPMGHYAGYDYPALSGKRGTLTCSADTLVSAIALRFIGYDAFSTLPVIVK